MIALIIFISAISALSSEPIARFIQPESGVQITEKEMTIHLDVSKEVDSVLFSIEFLSESGITQKRRLALIKRAPFRQRVDLSNYPNQYFRGAKITADIFHGEQQFIAELPHIYIYTDPQQPRLLNSYPEGYRGGASTLVKNDGTAAGEVSFQHSPNILSISAEVWSLKEGQTSLENAGLTILLDPTYRRKSYPGNALIWIDIPLDKSKSPQLAATYIEEGEHGFTLKKNYTPISLDRKIKVDSDGGYRVDLSIPHFLLGGQIPDTMGINIIAPIPGDTALASLFEGDKYRLLSPILFPSLVKSEWPHDLASSSYQTFLISLGVGALLGLILTLIISSMQIIRKKRAFEKIPADRILRTIEKEITNPTLSPVKLSELMQSPKALLEKSTLAATGKTLKSYILWCRLEIVKERLISSNCAETTIARECGFKTVGEMEDLFYKHVGVAPYLFREHNRVQVP